MRESEANTPAAHAWATKLAALVLLSACSACAKPGSPVAQDSPALKSTASSAPTDAPDAQSEQPPEAKLPEAKPPPPEPVPAPTRELFASVDLSADPDAVGKALARDWCEIGGATFHPISDPHPDDGYPYTLESCDSVTFEVVDRQSSPSLTATLMRIETFSEGRDLLLLQGASGQALVELARDFEDQSGEGGAYRSSYEEVELRDVSGDASPEWIAVHEGESGGSFEADRCFNTSHVGRSLIVCSWRGESFACFDKFYYSLETSEPWSDLEECGMTRSQLPKQPPRGYRFAAKLSRDKLKLSGKVLGKDLMGQAIEAGSFALDELFETEAVAVGVFPNEEEEF